MTFNQLKNSYFERYACEAYANDADTKNLLQLFVAAEALSDQAKTEFVKAFDFEYALDGMLYLCSQKRAQALYPHLLREASLVGIKIEMR